MTAGWHCTSSCKHVCQLCWFGNVKICILFSGATCQANTFDGERCLYSALTQKIKEMLKNFKAITKDCIRRDSYVEFFKM